MKRESIAAFRGCHVVVVGDVMLDELAHGDVKRISPEAPVPVLEVSTRSHALGGAGNAAANVASLDGSASLIGLIGDDNAGAVFEKILTERQIKSRLVRAPGRPTTHKTRYVARGQQIVRIDHEVRSEPEPAIAAQLEAMISDAAASADAFILSDYAKGTLSASLIAHVVAVAAARKIPVVADPKHRSLARYRGVSVITPNHSELELAIGRSVNGDAEFAKAAVEVLPLLGGGALLATRGADGMTLFEASGTTTHVPAAARSVFDVTGAGDTVVATLALALAARIPLADAIHASSAAAGVVVSKHGTATVSPAELAAALEAQ